MTTVFLRRTTAKRAQVVRKTHYKGVATGYENISPKGHILITGAHHAGKSKMLSKLFEAAEALWSRQVRPYKFSNNRKAQVNRGEKPVLKQGETLDGWTFPEPVMLQALNPLSQWVESAGVAAWWDRKNEGQPYAKLKLHSKVDLLAQYLKDTRAVLFIDDAHRLTGRKAQIATACVSNAYRWVAAADDEAKITPSLRKLMLDKEPQIIRLSSDVAYDATNVMLWLLLLVCMAAGATELAMAIGGMSIFAGGRRAAKQD